MQPSAADVLSTFFYSCAGGYADATGFLLAGSFAGHITGNLVLVSISCAAGHWRAMSRPLSAIVTFLLATEIGILSVQRFRSDLKWFLLLFQSIVICTLGVSAIRHGVWFDLEVVIAFSLCLGLQNGVLHSIDGVAVHPSYMTGTATRLLKSWSHEGTSQTQPDNVVKFTTMLLSGNALAGFVAGALSAAAAKAAVGTYAPLFLCLPLLAGAIASSQRWQTRHERKDPQGAIR